MKIQGLASKMARTLREISTTRVRICQVQVRSGQVTPSIHSFHRVRTPHREGTRSETKRRNDGDDDEPLDGGEDDVRDPDSRSPPTDAMRARSYTGTKTMDAWMCLSRSRQQGVRMELRANRLTMWTTTWNLYTRT